MSELKSPDWANNSELKALNANIEKAVEYLKSIDQHLFQIRGSMKLDKMGNPFKG